MIWRAAGKVPPVGAQPNCLHERSTVVTNDLYGTFTGRECSISPRLRLVVLPSAPAVAAGGMHKRFGITGANADVWPLNPKDWSTG
jgi:hypothetical protein